MKKFLMLGFIVLSLIGCQSDKKSEQLNEITGNWQAEKITLSGKANYKGFPVPFSQSKSNDCTKESQLILNKDQSGSTTIKDDTIGNCEAFQDLPFTYEYDNENKEMHITYNDFTETVKIQNVTADKLTIERSVENLSFGGVTFSGTITIDLVRQ